MTPPDRLAPVRGGSPLRRLGQRAVAHLFLVLMGLAAVITFVGIVVLNSSRVTAAANAVGYLAWAVAGAYLARSAVRA